jgi:hypothetical protein
MVMSTIEDAFNISRFLRSLRREGREANPLGLVPQSPKPKLFMFN